MEKITFVNNSEPYLSAENLNQMQDNFEEATHRDITTGGEPVKCGYQIDGKDAYVLHKSFGSMPNATSKTYDIGININTVNIIDITIKGVATWGTKFFPNKDSNASLRANGLLIENTVDDSSETGYVYALFTYK